jgi:aminoglycoside phosphotransferase (APT) family kinase protein
MEHAGMNHDSREPSLASSDGRRGEPILDPARATSVLQHAVSDAGWIVDEVRSVDLLNERPEKRRTLRFHVKARRAGTQLSEIPWYGHQYRGSVDGERMLPVLRFLRAAAAPEIRIPSPLGYSREARLLITTSMEGRPLSGVLEDPIESRVGASLKRLGRALASFHAIRSPGPSARSAERPVFGRWDAQAESAAVQEMETKLRASGLEPRVADRLAEGAAALRAELIDESGVSRTPSMIHGHLHPTHVIFGADGISVVDLDDAAFGEPERDLGELVAHMVLADLKRGASVRLAPSRSDALRAGYLGGGVLRPNRLAAYTSAALLRLGVTEKTKNGGVGAPDWTRLTAALIEEALPEAVRA